MFFIMFVNLLPSEFAFANDNSDYPSADEMSQFYYDEISFSTHPNEYVNYGDVSFGLSFLKKHKYNNIVIYKADVTRPFISNKKGVFIQYIASPSLTYDKNDNSFKTSCEVSEGSLHPIVLLTTVVYYDDEGKAFGGTTQFSVGGDAKYKRGYHSSLVDKPEGTSNLVPLQVGEIDNFEGYETYDEGKENLNANQLNVGEIVFTEPLKNAYMNALPDSKYCDISYTIIGKIPFKNSVDDVSILTSSKKLKSILQKNITENLVITLNGVECNTPNDFTLNIANSIKIDGDVETWIKKKYYTFTINGRFSIDSSTLKGAVKSNEPSKLKATIKCPIKITNTLRSKCDLKSYTTPSRNINLKVYVDEDKDGVDDNSGITIPDLTNVDTDNDGVPDKFLHNTDSPFSNDDYVDSSSSDDSSSDNNSKGILAFINQCINEINEFFSASLRLISSAKDFMIGFPQFIQGLFACFPNNISTFIALGLELMIIIAVVKFIRG